MNGRLSAVVQSARQYYNSDDADRFYHRLWGGEDIHIGLYRSATEEIRSAAQRTVETMAAMLPPLSTDSEVVDLGAGYGGAARWLSQRFGCRVACVNLSETQNARNRAATASAGLAGRIEVLDASFEDIPYEDARFDVAWSQDSILHSGDRERVLREVDRVLKPGGDFIMTDPMQSADCPPGVLGAVLERIHLTSLGSYAFYLDVAAQLGWEPVEVRDLTGHLVRHYSRVRDELISRRDELLSDVSADYVERMIQGLTHWILAGESGHLAWGILQFRKPR